jgi:hypothetical protein
MLGPGYVLRMGSIEGLHHLNAEASTVRKEDCELGHGGFVGGFYYVDDSAVEIPPYKLNERSSRQNPLNLA